MRCPPAKEREKEKGTKKKKRKKSPYKKLPLSQGYLIETPALSTGRWTGINKKPDSPASTPAYRVSISLQTLNLPRYIF